MSCENLQKELAATEGKWHQIMSNIAVLRFSTDLGLLPEEGDVGTGELLGNIPQTFVHASLMGAILDDKNANEDVGAVKRIKQSLQQFRQKVDDFPRAEKKNIRFIT